MTVIEQIELATWVQNTIDLNPDAQLITAAITGAEFLGIKVSREELEKWVFETFIDV